MLFNSRVTRRARIVAAAFEVAKTAPNGMHGDDVAVPGRRQAHEAEVEERADERRVVLERDALECYDRPTNAYSVVKSIAINRYRRIAPTIR
jgi:hypothetical protein